VQNKKTLLTSIYIFTDVISTALVWALFFYYRKVEIEKVHFVADSNFYYGLLFLPIITIIQFWAA